MKLTGENKDCRISNPQLDDAEIEKIRSELDTILAGE
jgi:hypothetical protein